jgi:hypothetical protein
MGWTSGGFSGDDDQRSWYYSAADAPSDRRSYGDWDDDIPADDSVHALVAHDNAWNMSETSDAPSETLIVLGSGISMGEPFIQRRERPMAMRIGMLTLITCILITGIFAISPLGTSQASGGSAFQALAGSIVWSQRPGYFFYTAVTGDTIDGVAQHFHVQVGGIYELNNFMLVRNSRLAPHTRFPQTPITAKIIGRSTSPRWAPPTMATSVLVRIGGTRLPDRTSLPIHAAHLMAAAIPWGFV